MGRTEEFSKRKQNRSARKRLRADAVEFGGIEAEAARKRRKKGVRKIMEGMCYTLPTPENPFNEPEMRNSSTSSFKSKPKPKQKLDANSTKGKDGKLKPKATTIKEKGPAEPNKDTEIVRRMFWPQGKEGKAPFESLTDFRVPKDLAEGMTAIFGPDDCRTSEGKSFYKLLERPGNLSFVCGLVEGCLRGNDVLAVRGSKEVNSADPAVPENGNTSSMADNKADSSIWMALGFILPAIVHVKAQSSKTTKGPKCLVLVKNAAIAIDLRKSLKALGPKMGMKSLCLHEDTPIERQIEGLQSQTAEFMVATPSRVCEILDIEGTLDLSSVTFLAIHEASEVVKSPKAHPNRLLRILSKVHPKCQRVLLSANGGAPLRQLADGDWLKDPIFRVAGGLNSSESLAASCAGISIQIQPCTDETQRVSKVLEFLAKLREEESSQRARRKTLVIVQSEEGIERIRKAVSSEKDKILAKGLSGEYEWEKRKKIVEGFWSGKVTTLVMPVNQIGSSDLNFGGVFTLVLEGLLESRSQYLGLVSSMARKTTKGKVFCVFTPDMAPRVLEFVDFLTVCGENVPSKLALMAETVRKARI